MRTVRAVLLAAIGCALSLQLLWAQDVHVSSDKGVTTFSVMAQKPYTLMSSGQARTPVLSISCQQKGKKFGHAITFSPGGILTEQEYSTFGSSATLNLEMTIGTHKEPTIWVAHGNLQSFDYYGKTEPERVQFVRALLQVPAITLDFTPFLTGVPVSSTFDLTGLHMEFAKHPECSLN